MTTEATFRAPAGLKKRFGDTYLNPLHIARRSLRHVLAGASEHVRGLTLDLGCGGKRYAALFPDVRRYVFLDLPSNSASEQEVSVWGDGCRLPFQAGVFDCVLCYEVIEHVPTPERVFIEAHRVLKPRGHLVLTTPQTWGLHEIPHDYYRYTEYGLRFLAENAGFTDRTDPTHLRDLGDSWSAAEQLFLLRVRQPSEFRHPGGIVHCVCRRPNRLYRTRRPVRTSRRSPRSSPGGAQR